MEIETCGLLVSNWSETVHCKECLSTLKIRYLDLKVGFRFVETKNKVQLYCREYYVTCMHCKSVVIIESENLIGKENKLSTVLKRVVDNKKHSCKPLEY